MNPLIKKEIRLLLPCCLISLALAFASCFLPTNPNNYWGMFLAGFPFLLCPAMVVILALESFGVEISSGIFTSLLAQSVPRQQIWRTKSTLLLAAMVIILVAWWTSFFLNASVRFLTSDADIHEVMLGTGLFALVVYSGGLWTVLLLRQVVAAFWFTLIVPAALLTISSFFLQDPSNRTVELVVTIVLTAYSIAGYLFARWLFLRAQDVAWTGGTIAVPELKSTLRLFADSGTKRTWRPKAALLGKELQLHSITLFFAGALLVLHIGIFFLRVYYVNHHRNSVADVVSEFFWVAWLVLPLTIGCAAVAEERKLGVMESQFCLPVSRRLQFTIKFIPAMIFGTLLGGVMPVLLESVALHHAGRIDFDFGSTGFRTAIIAISAGFSLAAFFASTLAKSFLQALSLAVVILFGCFWLGSSIGHSANQGFSFFTIVLWHLTPLLILISVPTAIFVFLWMTCRNFSYFQERGRLWRGNLLGMMGALLFIVVSSAAIYNRPWEIFEPAEPPHGPAKFSLANPPKFQNGIYGNLLVRLQNGTVWYDHLDYPFEYQPNQWLGLCERLINPLPGSGGPQQFIGGSNWVSVTAEHTAFSDRYHHVYLDGYLDTVGIKDDGTLWISSEAKPEIWTGAKMIRFDDETNWQQVSRSQGGILLLKTDGTLWHWGTNNWNADWSTLRTHWLTVRTSKPQQIGTDSDWKSLGNGNARKNDGTAWRINDFINDEKNWLQRDTNLDLIASQMSSRMDDNGMAYVATNGTLWVRNRYWEIGKSDWSGTGRFLQAGMETNWVTVAGGWNGLVSLKSDGSLWKWNLPNQPVKEIANISPIRLGIHNDWVGLVDTWPGTVTLAADGSLWLWPGERFDMALMKPSKQPELLGNIFAKSD
jgi:ABC-type transport system involved in multi-copper enzyme maturation permease subunit